MALIGVDFDGTCVAHRYPEIGEEAPGASEALREIREAGNDIIIVTMRSDRPVEIGGRVFDSLESDVWDWFGERDIELYGINYCPGQEEWTSSFKPYANVYIDDGAIGCPMREFVGSSGIRYSVVDWEKVKMELRMMGFLG